MGHGGKEFRRGLELPLMIHIVLGLAPSTAYVKYKRMILKHEKIKSRRFC